MRERAPEAVSLRVHERCAISPPSARTETTGQRVEHVVWVPSLVPLVGQAQLNQGTTAKNFPVRFTPKH